MVGDTPVTRQMNLTSGLLVHNTQTLTTDKLQTISLELVGDVVNYSVCSGQEILIGRGCGADDARYALDVSDVGGSEKGVSRRHAIIHIEGYSAYLIDLSSTNGTFLNGRRLQPEHRHLLYSNDVVRFGALEARVKLA